MDILFALEDSSIGVMISSSIWGYPIALSLHALGMGVLVGISVMLALRILGFADAIPRSAVMPYWRLAQAGFALNLISGTALFMGSAASLGLNWALYAKFICLIVSLFLTYRMVKVGYRTQGDVNRKDRHLAVAAICSWVATIIFGRLIGYIF